ncbi:MAG: hypothetical protein ACREID_03355, partial [Planctomycetota bacterium]
GFTVVEPRSATAAEPPASPAVAEPRTVREDFYKLSLLKPEGFSLEPVDAHAQPGIVHRFRRRDAASNLCTIEVYAYLARTMNATTEATAQKVLDEFFAKHPEGKAPKRPSRAGYPGSKEAYRFALTARQSGSGVVFQEQHLVVEHGNGWVYRFSVATYGAAATEWRKPIDSFWKGIRLSGK